MKNFFKKAGVFLVYLVACAIVFGIMIWVSLMFPKDSIFLQYLEFFGIIAGLLILVILFLELDNNIKENYRNLSNARIIQLLCFIVIIIIIGIVMWQKEPKQSQRIINLIKYIVSTVTATGIFTLIHNFLHPGTIQIKIWSTPTYEKNGDLYISSDFSVNVHNYNKKKQKVALLGVCLKEDKNKILKNKNWDTKLYLPNTLSARINKVPSCDDFESVLGNHDSESYHINIKDMLAYLKSKSVAKVEYLKLKKDNNTQNIATINKINKQLEQIYTTDIKSIESKLDKNSRSKCQYMFNEKVTQNEKDCTDLCIVYYVVDNPMSTSNLITKHFRVEN